MNKIYFRILIAFFIYIFAVNICTFIAGFNSKQLINIFHLKDRTVASIYLLKNIIFDTGVHIELTNEDETKRLINASAEKYGISSSLLSSFTTCEHEFYISLSGGMGLTSISPKMFKQSGFSDPFSAEQNLDAAAFTLRKLMDENTPVTDLKARFYGE
ncbi:MAG: hypothetical protein IJD28_06920 [Deferribacterales bacterium]|nr:hypothetical protein [Deferribacterales bacterium]